MIENHTITIYNQRGFAALLAYRLLRWCVVANNIRAGAEWSDELVLNEVPVAAVVC